MPSVASLSTPSLAACSAVPSPKASRIEETVMELFEELRNPVLRYVLSMGLPLHDAEELAQEVFLALFRHLQLGRSRANLRGWIFRVAHNLAQKQRLANHRVQQRMSPRPVAGEPCDPAPDPEEHLSAHQRRNRLLAVVHALPEVDQDCIRLRAEGLRYREIAAVLGMSLGAVSLSLTRSLARLIRADGR
jgi:RNA polymerase sigma-70 factor, ECF subfamily